MHDSSRFVQQLIDGALKDADNELLKSASVEEAGAGKSPLADLLAKVACEIEDRFIKRAYKKTLIDDRRDGEFNDELRQVFIGEDMDEKTVARRENIKHRLEQLGGISAPTI